MGRLFFLQSAGTFLYFVLKAIVIISAGHYSASIFFIKTQKEAKLYCIGALSLFLRSLHIFS